MVKHPAWAAAINSSGLVRFSFSKRVLKEYGVSASTPESVERLPLPSRPVPRHTAFALRIMLNLLAVVTSHLKLRPHRDGGHPPRSAAAVRPGLCWSVERRSKDRTLVFRE